MAYTQQHYRAPSQSSLLGLCSSNSYLDGVPFKISPAFRPTPQPSLPPELLHASTPSEALHQEYVYDTEEAVLAWSRAREEAKAKAIAERRRAALAAAQSSSSNSEEEAESVAEQSAAARDAAKTSQREAQVVKPPWQLPVGASLSSTILTPTPIQTAQKKVQSPVAPTTSVDLALFEQEDDPFDNMELQTINDMEELRTLLGGSQEPSPNPDSQMLKAVSEAEVSQVVGNKESSQEPASTKSTVSTANNTFGNIPGRSGMGMMDSKPSNSINCVSVSSNASNKLERPSNADSGTAVEPTADEDYVQLRADYSQQSVRFQKDSAPVHSKSGSEGELSLGGELPHQYTNSKIFKAVLPSIPPVCPRGKSLGGDNTLDGAAGSSICSVSQSSVPQSNSRVGFMGAGMSQSAYVMSTSASGAVDMSASDCSWMDQHHTNFSGSHSRPGVVAASSAFTNMYSRYGKMESEASLNGAGSERGGLRSAKSNPDLLTQSHSHSRPSSSSQPWNPYRPLPSTPVPDLRSSSSSPDCLLTEPRQTPSPRPQSFASSGAAGVTAAQPEHDPYPSLSSDAKTFVNNLTCMGFSRSRVSRAVEKFGADEREVVDHLLNVDKLVEKKFSPALAETGLQLYRNDICKAEQFLGLYQQFTELGFTGDRIQTALVKHELDRDKALDYLTT